MKKNFLLTTCYFIFCLTFSKAQTTATDFTENDCNGISHHLFSELESGKIIVMVFVMPCSSCVGPALTAYNIVQSFQQSNPGQVLYYLTDDVGNSTCSQIDGWANSNSIGSNRTSFSSPNINMNDYGIAGMPKIVVLGGGVQHKIYFNENDAAAGNSINIHGAISLALTETGSEVLNNGVNNFTIFMNNANSTVTANYFLSQVSDMQISIFNSLGIEIINRSIRNQNSGQHMENFEIEKLTDGIYFIVIKTNTGIMSRKIFIAN